jgi:hypothetical protein
MIINPEGNLRRHGYERQGVQDGFTIWESGGIWTLTLTDAALTVGCTIPRALRERATRSLHTITDVFYHGDLPLAPLPQGQDALGLGKDSAVPRWHDLRRLGDIFEGKIEWVWNEAQFPPGAGGTWCFWPTAWHQAAWNQLPAGTAGADRTGKRALTFELHVPSNPRSENYRISLVRNAHATSPMIARIEQAVNAGLFCKWDDDGKDTYALCKWGRPDRCDHLRGRVVSWRRHCDDLFNKRPAYTKDEFIAKWLSLSINDQAVRCLLNQPLPIE